MANEPIDLSKPPVSDPIDLTAPESPGLSPDTMRDRAERYAYAAGQDSPGPDQVYTTIQQGREGDLRRYLANKENIKSEAVRNQMLRDVLSLKNGQPLTDPEYKFFVGLSQQQIENPDLILEKLQARRTVSDLYDQSTAQADAYSESDSVSNVIRDVAEQTITKRQIAQKMIEDVRSAQGQEGAIKTAFDWGTYIIGSAVPFVYQYAMHGQGGAPFKTSFLTGNNRTEQYAYLMSLPPDEFYRHVKAASDDLYKKSPQFAQDFLAGILQYSQSDAFLDNALNVADIAAVVSPGLRLGRAGIKLGRAGRGSVRAAEEFSNEALQKVLNRTTKVEGRSQSVEEAVGEMYSKNVPTEQIAKELDLSEDEVARIKEYIDELPLGRSLAPGEKQVKTPDLPIELQHVINTGKPLEIYSESLKQTVKALDSARPDVKEVAAAAGHEDAAAMAHAVEQFKALNLPESDRTAFQPLLAQIPSFGDPSLIFRSGAFKLAREYSEQIADELKRTQAMIAKTLTDFGVSSLPPKAMAQAYALARQAVKEYATKAGVNDAILDVNWHPLDIRPESTAGNVGVAVVRLGRPDKTMFETPKEAENFIRQYGLRDAEVKQNGTKFVVQISRPVDETLPSVKDALIETDNLTPRSKFTLLLDGLMAGGGKFRTPSEVLSKDMRGVRSKLVDELAAMSRINQLVGEPVNSLPKASREKLSRFADSLRRFQDTLPDHTRVKGLELKSQSQFEILWSDMFKELPTPQESRAYWNLVNFNQYEYIVHNLDVFHYDARHGIRSWQAEKDGPWFDGKQVPKIDWEDPEGNILFINQNTGEKKLYLKPSIRRGSKKVRNHLDGLIQDEGYTIIQRADPRGEDLGYKAPVHFVLTKTAESKNLSFHRFPYKGGGHNIWDYGYYLKQPKLSKGIDGVTYHYGDNTIWGFTTGAESAEIEKSMETARQMLKSGNPDFDRFVRENTPFDPEVLAEKFKNRTLDIDTPIVAVRAGESTMSHPVFQKSLKGEWKSWQDSHLNLRKDLNKEFLGQRGWDPTGLRGEDDPVFDMPKPRLVDPLPMANQALGRVIRNKMFQPYQMRAAEHFVEEFHPVLEKGVENLDYLRQNPIATLYNPKFDVNTQDRSLLAAARTYQYHARQLMGTSTEFGRFQNWLRSSLLDSVYNKLGKGAAEKVYENLHLVPDPIKFSRQVAFHLKLGLFNPVQFWLQYQTFTNVLALSPGHAAQGLYGAILARFLGVKGFNVDEKWLDHFAGMASKFGWSKDDWKEMYQWLYRSGSSDIGPQHAFRSDHLDPSMFKSQGRKFLDKGAFFFNEGERGNHMAAFATAYHEWRTQNPLAQLTREAKQDIKARYDDLAVNMTHASSSALNRGLGATAGQFLSYQERLSELLLGKRLSRTERVRAFAIYAAMYGVPVSLSARYAYPFYSDIREYVLNHGLQDNRLVEGMMQGIPELLMHYALGSEFAYGERYGPNGIQLFHDLRNGDLTFWQLMTGASTSIARDIFESSVPAVKDIRDYVTGQGNAKVTMNDIFEVLKNTSTLSNASKGYIALATQKYMNQGQVVVDDQVNPQEALMMGIFGIQPTRINDIQIMRNAIQHRSDAQATARSEAKRYWRLGWRESDPETRKAYFKNAMSWMVAGDLNPQERAQLTAEAISEAETEKTKTQRSFDNKFPNRKTP